MPKGKSKPAAAAAKKMPQSEFAQQKKRRPFTVFLVMDDQEIRETLAESLKQEKIPVHDYMTAMEFYRDYREQVPGVLIADLRLRGMSAIDLQKKLAADKSDLPIVYLSGHADAPAAIEAMKEGAFDFVMKPVSPTTLLDAVARAYAFYYDVDWDFVGDDLDDVESSIGRLTAREKEVLDMIANGYSSRQIGTELGISTKTVEAHRARINDKTRADDLPHLIRMVFSYNEEQVS
jgi:FixJ family two-component response regulator